MGLHGSFSLWVYREKAERGREEEGGEKKGKPERMLEILAF